MHIKFNNIDTTRICFFCSYSPKHCGDYPSIRHFISSLYTRNCFANFIWDQATTRRRRRRRRRKRRRRRLRWHLERSERRFNCHFIFNWKWKKQSHFEQRMLCYFCSNVWSDWQLFNSIDRSFPFSLRLNLQIVWLQY